MSLHTLHETSDGAVMVLEYIVDAIPGSDAFITDRPADFTREDALRAAIQVAEGLEYTHSNRVIHRDLKLENILLEPSTGRIVISDFGLGRKRQEQVNRSFSQSQSQESQEMGRLTQDGAAIGTVRNMAPESIINSRTSGEAADVYGLGIMIYGLLTGNKDPLEHSKDLHPGCSLYMLLDAISRDPERRPAIGGQIEDRHINIFVHKDQSKNREIVKFLQRMTAFDPADRPGMPEVLTWLKDTLMICETSEAIATPRKKTNRGIIALEALAALGIIGVALSIREFTGSDEGTIDQKRIAQKTLPENTPLTQTKTETPDRKSTSPFDSPTQVEVKNYDELIEQCQDLRQSIEDATGDNKTIKVIIPYNIMKEILPIIEKAFDGDKESILKNQSASQEFSETIEDTLIFLREVDRIYSTDEKFSKKYRGGKVERDIRDYISRLIICQAELR